MLRSNKAPVNIAAVVRTFLTVLGGSVDKMHRLCFSALLMSCFLSTVAAAADDPKMVELAKSALPEATAGFEWVIYRNCAVLTPNGWNERTRPDEPEKKTIGAMAFSPEPFSIEKQFEHGYTVQVVAGFKAMNKIEPSKGAVMMIKPIADARPERDVLMFENKPMPGRVSYIFRYRDAPPGKTPLIVHKYFVAMDAQDTLHIFTYESPESQWENNWKTFGTPMIGKVAFIPFLSAAP